MRVLAQGTNQLLEVILEYLTRNSGCRLALKPKLFNAQGKATTMTIAISRRVRQLVA
jgi:hypothetical protein